MKHEPAWRRYLRFWGPEPASDVDDELQFHLQTKTDDLIAAGMPPDRARREAVRQFGPLRPIRNECREISETRHERASRVEHFAAWMRDIKYAARAVRRSKASSAAAILILAIGIGANTAVFTFLDRLLFRPLPVPKPSQLVLISTSTPDKSDKNGKRMNNSYVTYESYVHMRDHNQVFSGLGAESYLGPRERRLRQKIEQPAQPTAVSGNYFNVLGRPPLLGRALAPSDDVRSGASHVAVASYRFWTRRFNRAPDVLGRTIYFNDVPFTIVGVMPAGFFGTHQGYDPDVYLPLGSLPELFDFDPLARGASMGLIGRLRPGLAREAAQSNLEALWDQVPSVQKDEFARIECRDGSVGHAGTEGEKQRSLVLLAVIAALLLLMGCVNVACLLIARGAARQHEIAIRISLGAGKASVLRQTLMESGLLALAGGAAGLLVAFWADRLLLLAFNWKNRPIDLTPDWRVLAFGMGVSLVTGILFGLAPALQALRGGRVALTQDRTVAPRFASGRVLVVIEVALLIMVAGAAVFIRSFQNLRAVPTGFAAAHVSVIELASAEDTDTLHPPFHESMRLAESLAGAPGIDSAAVADFITFNDSYVQTLVKTAGSAAAPIHGIHSLLVDGGYFDALRIPLIAGRAFTRHDDERAPKVAVLGESAARRLFPDQNPIGRSIYLGGATKHPKPGDETEIVGVVKDIKFTSVAAPAPDLVFQPLLQGENHTSTVKLQVRSWMEPRNVSALVQSRIRDAHLPVTVQSATALEDRIGASLQNDRTRMQASSLFGVLALLLITAGIYGLMAYSVVRRTREIGIRMAVGSSGAGIVRLVLKDSLRLVLYGLILGLPGAIAVMKAISTMVFGLSPVDPTSLGVAALILFVTGIVASVAPAWRAAHLDPVQALRVQ